MSFFDKPIDKRHCIKHSKAAIERARQQIRERYWVKRFFGQVRKDGKVMKEPEIVVIHKLDVDKPFFLAKHKPFLGVVGAGETKEAAVNDLKDHFMYLMMYLRDTNERVITKSPQIGIKKDRQFAHCTTTDLRLVYLLLLYYNLSKLQHIFK